MKTHPRFAQAARFGLLAALNLYLLSPVLLYELGLSGARGGSTDKITLFALPASLLWLALIQLCLRPSVAHALLFPFYTAVAFDLYLITHYRTRLTSSTLTLLIENRSDGGGYILSHPVPILLGSVATVAIWLVGVVALRRLSLPSPKWLRWAIVAALVSLYAAVTLRQSRDGLGAGVADTISHDRNSPFGLVPQAFVAFRVYLDLREHQRAAQSFVFGATRASVPAEPEIFVVVIGESSRPDHWGLYGYSRDTTPQLAKEPNLVVFDDVVTQAALTQIAVPLILTRSAIDDDGARRRETSIVSLYRELGFSTHWFSTQQRDHYTGAINRYTAEAQTSRFLDRQYDGALVELVAESIHQAHPSRQKQLFVLHTQGSHGQTADRITKQFEIFPVGGERPGKEVLVNSYDNTILYTDHVLSELIALLKRQPGIAAMLYVADHGENLEDDERALLGHFFNNEYDLPVPMVLWYSDNFARRYPEKVAAVRANARARISTRSVFYTLADLADAVLDDPRLSTFSLLSPRWQGPVRQVMRRWDVVHKFESADYDQLPISKRSSPSVGAAVP